MTCVRVLDVFVSSIQMRVGKTIEFRNTIWMTEETKTHGVSRAPRSAPSQSRPAKATAARKTARTTTTNAAPRTQNKTTQPSARQHRALPKFTGGADAHPNRSADPTNDPSFATVWGWPAALATGTVVAYFMGSHMFNGTSRELLTKSKAALADEPTEAFDEETNSYLIFADLKPFKHCHPAAYEKALENTSRLLLLYRVLRTKTHPPQFMDVSNAQAYASKVRDAFIKLKVYSRSPLSAQVFRKAESMLNELLDHYIHNVIKLARGALPIDGSRPRALPTDGYRSHAPLSRSDLDHPKPFNPTRHTERQSLPQDGRQSQKEARSAASA